MKRLPFLLIAIMMITFDTAAQQKDFSVIAYYTGGDDADSFAIEKLTHIIYSFCHLKDNKLSVDDGKDSAMIKKLVSFKKRNPRLKVMLSLGGWGGCETCSDVFSTKNARIEFAKSVKELNDYFHTDGLDLDWEYPGISGYPGHEFKPEDKPNFTALVEELRNTLGWKNELSFAAGGFQKFIDSSIEWKPVMKLMDRVNLMSYDLVGGNSKLTGHHTPLHSTAMQERSADQAINALIDIGVDKSKIVIGAAFYGRMWENVQDSLNGLYQQGKFIRGVQRNQLDKVVSQDSGFVRYWDEAAHAPYAYNSQKKLFITYDDERSVKEKTEYVIERGLGGIMFWQLRGDLYQNGLLDAIDKARMSK
ncbi:glycoside hydrolase family 18 protein [soil metagenome]